MSNNETKTLKLRCGVSITIKKSDVPSFIQENFDFDDEIRPRYECEIDRILQGECDSCGDMCNDSCSVIEDRDEFERLYHDLRDKRSCVRDVISEYFKLNDDFAKQIVLELGEEEVMKILRGRNDGR